LEQVYPVVWRACDEVSCVAIIDDPVDHRHPTAGIVAVGIAVERTQPGPVVRTEGADEGRLWRRPRTTWSESLCHPAGL